MTVGDISLDLRYQVPDPYLGPTWAGRQLRRKWVGQDRPPKSNISYETIQLRKYKSPIVTFDDRTGRYYTRRDFEISEVIRSIRVPNPAYESFKSEPHPYSLHRWETNDSPILFEQKGSTNGRIYTLSWMSQFSTPSFGTSWTNSDSLQLASRLSQKINSGLNLGVALAELPQALGMIGSNALRLQRSLVAAKRGDFASAFRALTGSVRTHSYRRRAHTLDVAAHNWLELQYGWLPLMGDCYSATMFLDSYLNRPLKTKAVARYRRDEPLGNLNDAYGGSWDYSEKQNFVRGQVLAFYGELDWARVIGLKDPLSIIWEKIPYSFVVDWFLPIGNYLQARQTIGAIDALYVTSKMVRNYVKHPILGKPGYWIYKGGDLSSVKYDSIIFSRSVDRTFDIPLPNFNGLGRIASWKHCLNAVALLTRFGSAQRRIGPSS